MLMVLEQKNKRGFTLVELLVVIVVIGILLTVSFFGYQMWRTSAAEAEVKNDLGGAMTAMESAKNWGNSYPTFSNGATFDTGAPAALFRQSEHVQMVYRRYASGQFCLQATSIPRPAVVMHVGSDPAYASVTSGACPV